MTEATRFAALRDRHRGERCVLVANGPSLNRMDMRCLRGQTIIGLNKIHLGFERFGFYPRYYVAVNDKVVRQSAEQIRALNCVKFISARNVEAVPRDSLTYHLDTSDPKHWFYHDITTGAYEGSTVTFVALQVAYHLGFREVIIVGMDHHFVFSGAPHEAKVMQGPDPNHFAPDYFGSGQSWDNPDLKTSEESYLIARREFEKDGRRIIDATVGGRCAIFEKADYRTLLPLPAR